MHRHSIWPLYKKLLWPVALLAGLNVFGVVGYMVIEHYSLLDALYMTVITIGTVGFGEVHPLGDAGRLFTIFLIIASIGLVTFYITFLSKLFLDGEWLAQYRSYKRYKLVAMMEQHVIICGYGRNGKEAASVLKQNNIPYVVLEERAAHIPEDERDQHTIVIGNATEDNVLLEAGIQKARALITTLPNDADNLFVVLTANQYNPGLSIISRATFESSVSKLKHAGATNVIMPDKLGGAHMATLVMIPDVQEFITLLSLQQNEKFRIEELTVQDAMNLGELDLWRNSGCTVLGVKQVDGKYRMNPAPDFILMKGERIILMGSKEQIAKARDLLHS